MTVKVLYEKVKTKTSIQNKLEDLYTQKGELDSKVDSLKKLMLKEQKDVERLEKGNLASFFYEMVGKKNEKMDKERKESYEAKVKYDNAFYQLTAVNSDIEAYEEQLLRLDGCEEEYQEALNKKVSELKDFNKNLVNIEEEIISSRLLQKEVREALEAGEKAKSKALEVKSNLDNADGWATFDLLGGGLIADMAKYSSLDNVEGLVKELQVQLNSFKTELADIKIQADIQIAIGDFLRMADYIFDNFFTDFAVRDKIATSIEQVNETISQIDSNINQLIVLLEDEEQKEEKLKEELERIVIESE